MVFDSRGGLGVHGCGMNRIREFRQARKLTTYQLAELVGTTQATIHRLETGKRKLTVDWMKRIATALGVKPEDLIAPTIVQQAGDDVMPYQPDDEVVRHALKGSNRQLWKVVEPSLDYLNINPGDVIVTDASRTKLADLSSGDMVVLQVYDVRDMTHPRTLLRQYIAPSLFITNSSKTNDKPIDAKRCDVTILGVILPQLH